MGQEFSNVQDALKEMYTPAIINQIPKKAPLWAIVKKLGTDMYGKRVVIPVLLGFPESVGARKADDYTLPAADKSTYDQAYIYMKRTYGRVKIDGFSMESAKGKGGWVDLMTAEIENVTNAFAINIDRQTLCGGKGVLAQVNGAVAGQVITVDNAGGITGDTPTTKFFRKGQTLEFWTAGGAQHNTTAVVSAITATTITVVGIIDAVVNDDFVYLTKVYSATAANIGEMMGLDGVISDANAPGADFEGIDRSAVTEWQSYVKTSAGVLTEAVIQDILDNIEQKTDADNPDLLLTTYALRNKLISTMQALRKLETVEFKAGWKAIKYIGGSVELPIMVHKWCPVGYLYFLTRSALKFYVLKNIVWDDKGGGVIKPVSGEDAYEAWFKLYSNFSTNMPNSMGKGTGALIS